MKRRKFLKQGGLAATAMLVSAPSWNVLSASRQGLLHQASPKNIIVIGAGLAGLSAAYELMRSGHDVTILEARLRPGGRVLTLREPFSDGLYAEAGAARIPDDHHWTLKYARLFGLTLDPFYPSKLADVAYERGKRVRIKPGGKVDLSQLPIALTAEERKLGTDAMYKKYVIQVAKEMGDVNAPDWPPAALKKYDQINFPEFLRQQGASPAAMAFLDEPFSTPDEDDTSALWVLREVASSLGSKQLYKIRGGSDLLPKAFARRLRDRIHYGAPVVKIEHDTRGVRVVFIQGGQQGMLAADYLVCALPFTVLRQIEVAPRFSPEKEKAVQQLRYDSVTRVFLQSRQRFWEREGLNGFAVTDFPEEIWHPTFDQPGRRGILLSYMFDAQARRVGALPEKERVGHILAHLENIYPGLRENFEGGVSKCWDEDEWARGAYTLMKPGQMSELLPHVARAEGRVHFAGEHASVWNGWMQGALDAGNRVAREINKLTTRNF